MMIEFNQDKNCPDYNMWLFYIDDYLHDFVIDSSYLFVIEVEDPFYLSLTQSICDLDLFWMITLLFPL
jgi:hypothetical protein